MIRSYLQIEQEHLYFSALAYNFIPLPHPGRCACVCPWPPCEQTDRRRQKQTVSSGAVSGFFRSYGAPSLSRSWLKRRRERAQSPISTRVFFFSWRSETIPNSAQTSTTSPQ